MSKSTPETNATLVTNLFGGPGTGKSTTAAGVFCALKRKGINCELVTEFAKDLVWEKSYNLLPNQIWVFGVQHHRLWRLLGQVDVVVTDAPLLHSILYNQQSETLNQLVLAEHHKLNNLNIFLKRTKPFVQTGRYHNEEQSQEIDEDILKLLQGLSESFESVPCVEGSEHTIAGLICEKLNGNH